MMAGTNKHHAGKFEVLPADLTIEIIDTLEALEAVREQWLDLEPVSYTHLTLPTNREV